MKEKINIKAKSTLLPFLGLALLLLFSPCKVRNYIQAELGLSQTEVASKSKTTFTSVGCSAFEISEATSALTKSGIQSAPILAENSTAIAFRKTVSTHKSTTFHTTRNLLISVVPLYILYKNFKVYL